MALNDFERSTPYRRRQFVAPHRRKRLPVRLLRPLLAAAILVGLPAVAAGWVWSSPRFALSGVDVSATDRVNPDWATHQLRPLLGRHLLTIRVAEVERLVIENPWIREVVMHLELPDWLRVDIIEAIPVALVRVGGDLFYVDRRGMSIDRYRARLGGADLPLVSFRDTGSSSVLSALQAAEALQRAKPEWGRQLSEIEVLAGRDFILRTAAVPFPITVSLDNLEAGVSALDRVLPELRRHYSIVRSADLRFARQIVIQPAALPPSEES